jgi:membrane associated rhomboid family serine protease
MTVRTLSDYTTTNNGVQYSFLNNDEEQETSSNVHTINHSSMTTNNNVDSFWTWNLQQEPQWYHMTLLCFCPCLVGPVCSPARKADYRRLLVTFILWTTVLQIVYFIVELGFSGRDFVKNPSLGPSTDVLRKLGAKYAPDIKYRYHIHRLIVPIVMHAGIIHILMNLMMQLMLGLDFEKRWGAVRMSIIYILSGIAGNLLSCCVAPAGISVGASGALMGIIGARISDIICRWGKMTESERILHSTSLAIFLAFQFMMTFGSSYIDWSAHTGGLFIGFCVGLVVFSNEVENKLVKIFIIFKGIVLAVAYFVTVSLVFALVVKVPKV